MFFLFFLLLLLFLFQNDKSFIILEIFIIFDLHFTLILVEILKVSLQDYLILYFQIVMITLPCILTSINTNFVNWHIAFFCVQLSSFQLSDLSPQQPSILLPQEPSVLSSIRPIVKCNSKDILRKNFSIKNLAASCFPPVLSDSTTRQAIQRFQNYIAKVESDTEQICASCGLTTLLETTSFLHKTDSLFQRCIDR